MNLVPLFEEALEFQNYNGTVLSNGKVAVFYIGRTRLADIFNDIEGLSPAENPRILDNLGMGPIYVNPAFDYEMVVYDAYDNELFSVKKYVLSKGEHSTANVVVTPSEHIAVSAWTIGDVQVYMPYLVGEVGKTYEGILPIVVNNDVNRISAQHIPLGVQDPLYFVEDSETACIIGCSAQTEIPSVLSSKWDEASDTVIANSAQWAEGTEYEAGSYIDIDGHTISVTGLQPEGDYAYNSALSSKLDVTALPQDLVHSGDLTAYYPSDNPSGFITGVDLTDYATIAQLDEKLDKSDSGNFYPMEGNPSGFLTAHQSLQGYATEQWVEDKGYITSIDIQESANWNATTETVSSNSAQWGASNPQIPVTGINGIKISESGDKVVFEVSGDYYPGNNPSGFITGVDLSDYATTAQVAEKQDLLTFGYHDTAISSIDESAIYDNSAHARINTLAGRISDLSSNKLDTTAFSDVSGKYLPMTTSGLSASGTYLIDAISNNRILGINTSGISANPNGGVTSVQVGGYNSPEIKIKGYYGTMELNSAGAQYLSSDNSVVWKVGEADHLYVTNKNPDYQDIAIDISQAPRNVDTTRVMIGKNGLSACNIGSSAGMNTTNAPATIVGNTQVKVDFQKMHSVLTVGDIYVQHNDYDSSQTWSLTGSVQKREIEGDTATSAITAIAGSAIGGGIPAGTMNESAFEYDENDKISGYNGSAFAGGSDVPEGVMVESGLEYNAVQEISGYNGSAIAQYGAEKQWLVHDDTLVHAANSAQYALGVNLSAVAQLLGVDETVLWSGVATTGTLTASESVLNFDHYKIYISERERGTPSILEFHTENTATSGNNANTSNGGFKAIALTMFQNSNQDFFTINSNHAVWNDSFTELSLSTTGYNKYMTWNSSGFNKWENVDWTPTIRIHKIVGIGRKEV